MNRDLIRDDPVEFTYNLLKKKLHKKQEIYLQSREQFKNALWGRRAGKTTTDAVDLIHWAVKYPGCIQYNLSFTLDQAMIAPHYAEAILRQAGLSELLVTKPVHTPFGLMKFIGAGEVHARSLQHHGKFVLGHGAHRVKVDEAGICPDRTVENAVMPMLADYNGQLCKSGVPWGRNHFYRSCMEGLPTAQRPYPLPGNFTLHCPSWENPFISADYIEILRQKFSDLQFRTECGAEFMDGIGKVFSWVFIEAAYNLAEGIKKLPHADHMYVAGWDFAKHLDWTVGYVLDVTDENNIYVVHTERFQKESYDYIVDRVVQVSNLYHTAMIALDATGVGAPLVDRINNEVANMEAIVFTADTKNSLMNNLKMLMEQGRIKFDYEDNEELVSEMRYYSYELSKRSDHVLMGTQKEHDDCVTALALATWAFTNCFAQPSIGIIGGGDGETKGGGDAEMVDEDGEGFTWA